MEMASLVHSTNLLKCLKASFEPKQLVTMHLKQTHLTKVVINHTQNYLEVGQIDEGMHNNQH